MIAACLIRDEIIDKPPYQFFRAIAQHGRNLVVGKSDFAFRIDYPHAFLDRFDDFAVSLFTFVERHFYLFSLGNIHGINADALAVGQVMDELLIPRLTDLDFPYQGIRFSLLQLFQLGG